MQTVTKTRDDLVTWLETQPMERDWNLECPES